MLMSECSFCGVLEAKYYPLCQSCGALRYPVSTNNSAVVSKLKLSASVAAAIVAPGGLLVLAVMGAKHLNRKTKQ